MATQKIIVRLAGEQDYRYIQSIIAELESAAASSGTGICKRTPLQLQERIASGHAVIALTSTGSWVGFCYIQAWDNETFLSTCALVVAEQHRHRNVATRLKEEALSLARMKYPAAIIFGLTTSRAVMKINSRLGFKPITYSELTGNDKFWAACKTCPNYDILMAKERRTCLCTAMAFDISTHASKNLLADCERSGEAHADETSLQKNFAIVENV